MRLDKHLARFRAYEKLRMELPYNDKDITEILRQCVTHAGLEDGAYVEMIMTRGHSPTFSRDPRDAVGNFKAFAIPFGWIANEERRIPPESVDLTVKNYHWLDLIASLFEAHDRGRENVVLVDSAGNVTEGLGFNLFAVKDGRAYTPEAGVLHGITRQTALDLCAETNVSKQL